MEKEQLVRLIISLHSEMKELVIGAGIPEAKYQTILEIMDESTLPDLMELHTWLTEFFRGPYDNVLKVWERHKPETWKQYEIMQVYNLAEQILLRKRNRELREAWKGAPHHGKKRKTAKSDKSDGGSKEMSVRPKEAGSDESSS